MTINPQPDYKKYTLWLIAFFFVFRCLLAAVLELGNDEAYYWLYTQKLQWNYFDHPPMVALLVKLFTFNSLLDQYPFFLRLGSIVGCAISAWFLFKAVSILHSQRAGFFAAALYNASFYAGVTAGLYVMPDSPQMIFWTFCFWMLARISVDDNNWKTWIFFGIGAGLCIMSKIHGIFIPAGVVLFALLYKRAWLKKPQFYLSLIIIAFIISPILFWNIEYDFITYSFHSKRVTVDESAIKYGSFLKEILHQSFFNNPFNVALIILAVIAWLKKRIQRTPAISVYFFIGLPLSCILLFVSLFRDTVLIHWSGPAYVSLLPVAAIYLAEVSKKIVPQLLRLALGTFIIVTIAWTLAVDFYPGTVGKKNEPELGTGDITLDLYGWKEAGKQFADFYKEEVSSGIVPQSTPVVCTYWWGAHVEYYFCKPLQIQMIGLGPVNQLHQYTWLNYLRKDKVNFTNAYCIMPSDENYSLPVDFYSDIQLVKVISIKRNNQPAHNFRVYRLSGWKGNLASNPIV